MLVLRITLLFLLGSFIASNATARLWETETENEALYGKPLEKNEDFPEQGKLYVYRYKHFEVMVTFEDGKSQNEFSIREDRKSVFTAEEIQFFLNLNSVAQGYDRSGVDTGQSEGSRCIGL